MNKKILILDVNDKRIKEAAEKAANFSEVVLLDENVKNSFRENGQKYLDYYEGKTKTTSSVEEIFNNNNILGMILLALGEFDALIGGLTTSTAELAFPAIKLVGAKQGGIISSVMILSKDDDKMIFADPAIIPFPNSEKLSKIALLTEEFSQKIFEKPFTAFLSFSTYGSANQKYTKNVIEAKKEFDKLSKFDSMGEVQFDAAYSYETRVLKVDNAPKEKVTNFIFPDLNSANIGYKIASRLGDYKAIGPILIGTNKPISDLSRGASVEEIVETIRIMSKLIGGKNE